MGRTAKPTTEMTTALNSAPRLRISRTESGQLTELILDVAADVDALRAAFLSAFGTTELVIAEALFEQILNALHTDPKKPLDDATANLVLALLHRIHPRDELEANDRGRVRDAPLGACVLRGAAFGVAVHLVRDVGTSPVALLWPGSSRGFEVPHRAYATALVAVTAVAVLASRLTARARPARGTPPGHRAGA